MPTNIGTVLAVALCLLACACASGPYTSIPHPASVGHASAASPHASSAAAPRKIKRRTPPRDRSAASFPSTRPDPFRSERTAREETPSDRAPREAREWSPALRETAQPVERN